MTGLVMGLWMMCLVKTLETEKEKVSMKGSPTAAHQRYRNKDGKIVPGVTTVLGLLAKPALVGWAWKLGMQGEDMNKVKELAAEIGSATHYMAECRLKGETPDFQHFTPYAVEIAKRMMVNFDRYLEDNPAETLGSEVEMVSESWQFGGCVDWVAIPKKSGKVTLRDFKTSAGIYPEYKIQLSAYEVVWNELHPDQPIEAREAIHLDKETGLVTVHPFGELKTEFEIFKHLRAVYMLQKGTDLGKPPKRKPYRRKAKTSK